MMGRMWDLGTKFPEDIGFLMRDPGKKDTRVPGEDLVSHRTKLDGNEIISFKLAIFLHVLSSP